MAPDSLVLLRSDPAGAASEKPLRAVAFAPNGLTVATAGDDQIIHTWSAESGAGFNKEVTSVRFVGLGGEMLTASGDTKVRMLKEDGGTLRDFGGSEVFIFSTAVSADGRIILGGGQDSVLRAWDGANGKSLFSLAPPPPETEPKSANPPAKQ